MIYLIMDAETMGSDSLDCAVVDFSFMLVDTDKFISDNPYTLRDVASVRRFKLSVKDQVQNYGYKVEQGTVDFWSKQLPEVKARIAPKKGDLTLVEFTDLLLDFFIESPRIDYWFSRSNTFDPILLYRMFKSVGKLAHLNEHLRYWRPRDTRTWIDAKLNFPTPNGFIPVSDDAFWKKVFKEHDSAWDVIADVLRLQTIARVENDLEMTQR